MILRKLENSRFFLLTLLVAALVLLAVTASELGGQLPARTELKGRSNPTDVPGLLRNIETLFSPSTLMELQPATNGLNPFYTTYFQPSAPPTQAAQKTNSPAKPVAKKVQLTYQGVYGTADGKKRAFVKVGDTSMVGDVGAKVVADWMIAEIALRTLTLKNAAAQTNILEFNVSKEIELPNP